MTLNIQISAYAEGQRAGMVEILRGMWIDAQDCCVCARQATDFRWLESVAERHGIDVSEIKVGEDL